VPGAAVLRPYKRKMRLRRVGEALRLVRRGGFAQSDDPSRIGEIQFGRREIKTPSSV